MNFKQAYENSNINDVKFELRNNNYEELLSLCTVAHFEKQKLEKEVERLTAENENLKLSIMVKN
ncbi:hypothetical protein [Sulfurimonas sp.]|uniref:hypothetical protein n=1 Tax=Sulfurimonas sp. TaxID=2022749 RepID=UPI002AB30E70|nr:hypothetical protein [Sulfurimonas sp.]